jgi:hypothetical protein
LKGRHTAPTVRSEEENVHIARHGYFRLILRITELANDHTFSTFTPPCAARSAHPRRPGSAGGRVRMNRRRKAIRRGAAGRAPTAICLLSVPLEEQPS